MIPLHLVVESSDMQVLDLMSSPNVPVIRLMRTMTVGYDRGGGIRGNAPVQDVGIIKLDDVDPVGAFKNLAERVQKAGWWPLPVYDKTVGERRELQGEIHLPANLQATAHLGLFNYYVCPTFAMILIFTESAHLVSSHHISAPGHCVYLPRTRQVTSHPRRDMYDVRGG